MWQPFFSMLLVQTMNNNDNQKSSGCCDCDEVNPFAGLARTPLPVRGSCARSAIVGNPIPPYSPARVSGALWAEFGRAINKKRWILCYGGGCAEGQQLHSIINFASMMSNISKDLKQALMDIVIMAAKQDHEQLVATATAAER